jgi:hypothetical protein
MILIALDQAHSRRILLQEAMAQQQRAMAEQLAALQAEKQGVDREVHALRRDLAAAAVAAREAAATELQLAKLKQAYGDAGARDSVGSAGSLAAAVTAARTEAEADLTRVVETITQERAAWLYKVRTARGDGDLVTRCREVLTTGWLVKRSDDGGGIGIGCGALCPSSRPLSCPLAVPIACYRDPLPWAARCRGTHPWGPPPTSLPVQLAALWVCPPPCRALPRPAARSSPRVVPSVPCARSAVGATGNNLKQPLEGAEEVPYCHCDH